MKKCFSTVFLLSVLVFLGCASYVPDRDVLYQVSAINALLKGNYDGEVKCGKLKEYGNFGIGTFDALDGEMVFLEGKLYQIKSDGKVYPAGVSLKTPFAAVTFFEPDQSLVLSAAADYKQLCGYLDKALPTKNIFHAVRIDAEFPYVKVRSVPAQKKPYPALIEVTKTQPVFELHNVKGALVGFRVPVYLEGINVAGYHFHFISEDRKSGGHLLDCRLSQGKAAIDYTSGFYMTLPQGKEFYRLDLTGDTKSDLNKAEK